MAVNKHLHFFEFWLVCCSPSPQRRRQKEITTTSFVMDPNPEARWYDFGIFSTNVQGDSERDCIVLLLRDRREQGQTIMYALIIETGKRATVSEYCKIKATL